MQNVKKLFLLSLISAAAITSIQADQAQEENNVQIKQLEKAFREAATELEEKNNMQADVKEENSQETTLANADQTAQLPEEEQTEETEEMAAENLPETSE